MADIVSNRCEVCRFSCKKDAGCGKFFPKECFLGKEIHFKADPSKRSNHNKTSHMCVVCKEHFHYSKITWKKLPSGYYPFCVTDALRATFIAQNVRSG